MAEIRVRDWALLGQDLAEGTSRYPLQALHCCHFRGIHRAIDRNDGIPNSLPAKLMVSRGSYACCNYACCKQHREARAFNKCSHHRARISQNTARGPGENPKVGNARFARPGMSFRSRNVIFQSNSLPQYGGHVSQNRGAKQSSYKYLKSSNTPASLYYQSALGI